MAGDDYRVGYGRPPKKTSSRKDIPVIRAEGQRAREVLPRYSGRLGNERVTVTSSGQTKTLSKLEAIAIQMANKAAAGDPKAIHTLLYWIPRTSDAEAALDPGSAPPDESDAKMMAQLLKRMKRLKADGDETRLRLRQQGGFQEFWGCLRQNTMPFSERTSCPLLNGRSWSSILRPSS